MPKTSNPKNIRKEAQTFDLKVVRKNPHLFIWGKVIKIHDIGKYTLIEAQGKKELLQTKLEYHCYLKGIYLGRCEGSLDKALLLCIAFGRLGYGQSTEYMVDAALKILTKKP
jgi:hypothetical protein